MKKKRKKRKTKTELPQQLRAWRKRHKLSQSTAAIKLRMSVRTLQESEQGSGKMRISDFGLRSAERKKLIAA